MSKIAFKFLEIKIQTTHAIELAQIGDSSATAADLGAFVDAYTIELAQIDAVDLVEHNWSEGETTATVTVTWSAQDVDPAQSCDEITEFLDRGDDGSVWARALRRTDWPA